MPVIERIDLRTALTPEQRAACSDVVKSLLAMANEQTKTWGSRPFWREVARTIAVNTFQIGVAETSVSLTRLKQRPIGEAWIEDRGAELVLFQDGEAVMSAEIVQIN